MYMTLNASSQFARRQSMLNPFCGSVLGRPFEARVRSFHLAVRKAYLKTACDRPALAVFAFSSGDPIRLAFETVGQHHGFAMPRRMMLPLTSHHVHGDDKAEFMADFRAIRQRSFIQAAKWITDALRRSRNPDGPVYIIDEALSGACVMSIMKRLKARLAENGMRNEIRILALASQKKMLFTDDFTEAAQELAARDGAYIHPAVYQRKHVRLRPTDVQLTTEGLGRLLSEGIVSFKAPGFNELIAAGVATAFPVLDLFTTDNLKYNPLLFLDRENGVLKDTARSYSGELLARTQALLNDCGALEAAYLNKGFSKDVERRMAAQPLPAVLKDQI